MRHMRRIKTRRGGAMTSTEIHNFASNYIRARNLKLAPAEMTNLEAIKTNSAYPKFREFLEEIIETYKKPENIHLGYFLDLLYAIQKESGMVKYHFSSQA